MLGKDSEQFIFFSRMWELSAMAVASPLKDFYVSVSSLVFENLKITSISDLQKPLNDSYKLLSKFWVIDDVVQWDLLIKESDNVLNTYENSTYYKFVKQLISIV